MGKEFFDRFTAKLDKLKDKGFGGPSRETLNQRLETAVRNGWRRRADYALAAGARIDAPFPSRVAVGDKLSGHTPLAAAVRLDNMEMVDLLLLFNPNTEVRSNTVGQPTALGTAVMLNNLKMVQKLIAAGANVGTHIEELVSAGGFYVQFDRTPLVDYARQHGMPKIAQTLEEALQRLAPVPEAAQVFTTADLGAAFRENCCKGAHLPIVKPKTARFTKRLSR